MNDIVALKDELLSGHPVTGAYDADDVAAAAQINVEDRTEPIGSISGDAIFAATDGPEFIALSDHKQALWLSFCGRVAIDPFGASNVSLVKHVFGEASATVAALGPLRTKAISRAMELGFIRVRPGTIAEARAL